MHVQTHILSGWCVAHLIPRFARRDRFLCLLAASFADLDGLGIVFGQDVYSDYHHKLGHNLPYGVILCAVLAAFATRRVFAFAVCLALYHLRSGRTPLEAVMPGLDRQLLRLCADHRPLFQSKVPPDAHHRP